MLENGGDMKLQELRNTLKHLGKEELAALLLEIGALRKENLEWLSAKLRGSEGIEGTSRYYKKKIEDAFFADEKIHLKEARQAISDFKRISQKKEHLLDLMIVYTECGTRLAVQEGDLYESFYDSISSMFIEVVRILETSGDSGLMKTFRPRLKWIIEHSAEGWGMQDTLGDYFEEMGKGTLRFGETDEDK